jgi:hypothetical protein
LILDEKTGKPAQIQDPPKEYQFRIRNQKAAGSIPASSNKVCSAKFRVLEQWNNSRALGKSEAVRQCGLPFYGSNPSILFV